MSSSQAPMDNNDDGWDLFAVVRSCRTSSRPPPPPNPTPPPPEITPETMFSSCFPSLTTSGISHCDLERLCKPFFSTEALKTRPSSAPAKRQLSQSLSRVKRGRSQQKKVVCQVPADGLAADMWAWRKYGQKPIKGSPFPRGYYRCSSSKGCLARKQVERSRSDAGMFVITYTGDHNHQIPTHRNSLAGSTRQKVPAAVQGNLPEGSPNTPLKREEEEEEEDDEGVLLVEDMEVVGEDEVFFMGVEGLRDSPEVCSTTVFEGEFGGGELDGGFLVHPWSERRKDGR